MLRVFNKALFYITFTILSLGIFNSSIAEIVKKIEINGNERIPQETIIVFSSVKIGQDVNPIDLNNVLKNLYETNYFKNVRLSLKDNKLIIFVEENPIIGSINFKGIKAKRIIKALNDNMSLKNRSSYSDLILKNDKEKIYKTLRDLGYYFSDVNVLVKDNTNNIVDIVFQIELGDKTKISKITFNGNKNFKSNKLQSIIVSEEYKFWKFISGRKYLKDFMMLK